MNAVLAIINANIFRLNSSIVTFTQLLITALTTLFVLLEIKKIDRKLIINIAVFFALVTVVIPFKDEVNIKAIYSALIIPIFIFVGFSYDGNSKKFCSILLYVVFFFALLEVFLPSIYLNLFDPNNYYISTRNWAARSADLRGTSLTGVADFYYGSYRPGGTAIGLDTRIGGAFLEPISAGFFGFVCFLFLYYMNGYKLSQFKLEFSMCLLICILSDTRLSFFLIILAIGVRSIRIFITPTLLVLLPIIIFSTLIVTYFILSKNYENEMVYRLSITFEPIIQSELSQLLTGNFAIESSVNGGTGGDSGLIKLFSAAGLLGAIYLIYFITAIGSGLKFDKTYATIMTIFFIFSSIFTVALLSIKLASLYGFFCGQMIKRSSRDEVFRIQHFKN